MRVVIEKYKSIVLELFKEWKLLLLILLFVTVASYGFTVTNFSVSKDDAYLKFAYSSCYGLLRMRRWGSFLFANAVQPYNFTPFFGDFIGVSLLFTAALSWCVLFKVVSLQKIKTAILIIFSTVFISFPLINEIFIYIGGSFNIGMGYLLTSFALILSYEYLIKSRNWLILFVAILFLSLAVAVYESFAAVYLFGVFSISQLIFIYDINTDWKTRKLIKLIVKFCLILLVAVLIKEIIGLFFIKAFNLTTTDPGSANQIAWFNTEKGIFETIVKLLQSIGYHFIYNAVFYQPIMSFLGACLVCGLISVVISKRRASFTPVFLFMGQLISVLVLAAIQGRVTPYRACQTMALFVAFAWMMGHELSMHKKMLVRSIKLVVFLIVYFQVKNLNQWFYNDYRRFEMDKNNFIECAQLIERECGKGCEKPVAIVGTAAKYLGLEDDLVCPWAKRLPRIRTVSQNNGISVFCKDNIDEEFFRFMEVYGFYFVPAGRDLIQEAEECVVKYCIPAFPKNGSVREFERFVVVYLGP